MAVKYIVLVNMYYFFFFKQKTAYEMELRLEFRRVLFRSDGGFLGEGGLQRLDSLLGREELELRVLSESLGLGIAELALFEAHVENRGILADDVEKRSEERRVGKECRSRWSAYPEETKEKI